MNDAGQDIDPAKSHVAISHVLPGVLPRENGDVPDEDVFSIAVTCASGALPRSIRLESRGAGGAVLDAADTVPVSPAACSRGSGAVCGSTPPLRATFDFADRAHAVPGAPTVRAEVGGVLSVIAPEMPAIALPVGGPTHSALGSVERFRARIVAHVVRLSTGGAPAVGHDAPTAAEVVRSEVQLASMVWGQCGIHFGPAAEVQVEVVDPPPRHLLAIGCEVGAPASGGEIRVRVGKSTLRVVTHPGDSPTLVAARVAGALRAVGYRAVVAPNARAALGALRTADVLVRLSDGALADMSPVEGKQLSTDRTLPVCLGDMDLTSGLRHFDDGTAASGTLEERTLVKAFEDGDPTTLDVFVVPSFAKTGRIGESFIDGDGSGIENTVIVDRLALLTGSRTYALAHELGHVLLDLPGHPDDFGVDKPWSLMDSDSADPGVYGPRMLSREECERAIRQSGPTAPVPLLTPWPLDRLR